MLRSILLKEYLKLRGSMLAALLLNLAVVGYIYTAMRKLFLMDHAEVVWYRVMHLGTLYYDPYTYVPVLTGALLAAAQFLPETVSHRFRISLHLPLSPHMLVLGHILVGLSAVAAILAIDAAVIAGMTAMRFPAEVVTRTMLTILPWTLAGVTAYLGVTLVLLEPTWRLRMVNAAIGAGLTSLLLWQEAPGAYERILPLLALGILAFVPSVLYPAYRFRYRRS
ncbi:hypothetical protein [Salidesulfovibrio brasiliensis]|uniref:hypothetical protein n=1 Tax=Salidesulfovibrio brasiliensis TaxID=221711 RepID=UPI0006D04D59|nr:hypothetical protein [Salidesulfovibrio brasiliensis]